MRVACRDTQHLFDTDARILAIEGVERTETSLVMGEVIGYRVTPLMELARRDRDRGARTRRRRLCRGRHRRPPHEHHAHQDQRAAGELDRRGHLRRNSHAKPRANSTSDSPTNDATREPMRGTAITPNA